MFFAIMLPVFIVMIAFAVDYGVITLADHQLQIAADNGAISALNVMQSDRDNADKAAVDAVNANFLIGNKIPLVPNRDVDYGTWDEDSGVFSVIPRDGTAAPIGASAVRVRLTRNREQGNGLRLFFAPVIGTTYANAQAEAIASTTTPCSGFIGLESVQLTNNAKTDSYNSENGPYNSWSNSNDIGDICSNGPLTLASGARINGNAAGGPVTISPGSGASISGSQSGPANLTFDDVDFSEATINNNGNIERGPVWAPPFYNEHTGDLVVNNGRSITLQDGTYHFNNADLAGGSTLNVKGEVKIYVDGSLKFNNGTVANQSQLPKNLQIFVGTGPIDIQGGHQLHAAIYAPKADVTIANGSGFFGTIVGRSLSVAGGGGLHRDESLAPTTGGTPRLVQ